MQFLETKYQELYFSFWIRSGSLGIHAPETLLCNSFLTAALGTREPRPLFFPNSYQRKEGWHFQIHSDVNNIASEPHKTSNTIWAIY